MIRSAQKSDLASIAANEATIFHDHYPYFVLRQFFDIDPELLVVATGAAGEVHAHGLAALNLDLQAWILAVGVVESARGRSLGGQILDELCKRLMNRGANSVRATIAGNNGASLRLFQDRGFQVVGEEEDWFGPNEARLLVALDFNET